MQKCDDCQSLESWPYLGHGRCLCRKCVGQLVQALLRYIRGFDRDHPRPKKPRNQSKPVTDLFGGARCRGCEAQMPDWKPGDAPFCEACDERPRHNQGDDPVKAGARECLSPSEGISPGTKDDRDAPTDPGSTADDVPAGAGLLCR